MLMWITREPRPDSLYWPGRRLLAAIDALAWPIALMWLLALSPWRTGIFGAVVIAAAGIACLRRLRRALLLNHRYRFATWTWGGRLAALLASGFLLKLVL